VVLNQCFAGVFNLLDVAAYPPLVLIGATNLNNSISTGITLGTPVAMEDGTPGIHSWSANLFSWNFFRWLATQQDVDGDGQLTILDAYKFAGAMSNQQLLTIKSRLYMDALRLADELRKLQQQLAGESLPQTPEAIQQLAQQEPQRFSTLRQSVLEMKATEERLTEMLKMLYLHQEPWILHATLARRLVVAL
jgi:hypothetical protein